MNHVQYEHTDQHKTTTVYNYVNYPGLPVAIGDIVSTETVCRVGGKVKH